MQTYTAGIDTQACRTVAQITAWRGRPSPDAPQAIVLPSSSAKRQQLIWLISFIKHDRDAALLFEHYCKRAKQSPKQSALNDALLNGYSTLVREVRYSAERLTARGHLLFAFHGTTALEGCDL